MSIWRARDGKQWSQSLDKYRLLAEAILQQGEPLLAFDVVTEGLSILPSDVRLRQLQGLALARSGATERANAILEGLRRDGQTDEETLGMLGRTCKDLAANAASAPEREKFLRRAAETYAQAYQATGGYWTGINAATMNLLIGEKERACEIANVVRAQCLKAVKGESGNEYWLLAALGEAALILQDWPQAEEWYERAAKHAGHHWGRHSFELAQRAFDPAILERGPKLDRQVSSHPERDCFCRSHDRPTHSPDSEIPKRT